MSEPIMPYRPKLPPKAGYVEAEIDGVPQYEKIPDDTTELPETTYSQAQQMEYIDGMMESTGVNPNE